MAPDGVCTPDRILFASWLPLPVPRLKAVTIGTSRDDAVEFTGFETSQDYYDAFGEFHLPALYVVSGGQPFWHAASGEHWWADDGIELIFEPEGAEWQAECPFSMRDVLRVLLEATETPALLDCDEHGWRPLEGLCECMEANRCGECGGIVWEGLDECECVLAVLS